jgi:hypothetical protein
MASVLAKQTSTSSSSSNSKYSILNINNQFKGKGIETQEKKIGKRV